jgi:DNA-binding CsgD family transcriptional regulator
MVDEFADAVQEIYGAIGDCDRWRRLTEHLAAGGALRPEFEVHLQIAGRAHGHYLHVKGRIDALMRVYSQLGVAVLVLDRDARLLEANAVARRVLDEQSGLALVQEHLAAESPAENAALRQAIERASAAAGSTPRDRGSPFALVRRPGRPPLALAVLRTRDLPRRVLDGVSSPVVLLVLDPERLPERKADVLRALFGFTPREAEFACVLMRGESVADAARAMRVTLSTARTFLARVTAKTNSCSQALLMERLLAIPPVSVDPGPAG